MSRPPKGTDAGGKIRVLVAEDDDPVRELLVDFLAREGYQVTGVSDGLQAVAELEANSFDLVISDLFMPGLGGIDVLREARKIDPEYAVIVITGVPLEADGSRRDDTRRFRFPGQAFRSGRGPSQGGFGVAGAPPRAQARDSSKLEFTGHFRPTPDSIPATLHLTGPARSSWLGRVSCPARRRTGPYPRPLSP